MVLMGQTQPPSNRQSLSEGEMAEQKKENSSKFISVELAATRLEIRDVNMYKKGAGGVGVCEGNCDSDIDCGIGLMSFQRDRNETLSGCSVATMFFSPVLLRGRELLAVSLYTFRYIHYHSLVPLHFKYYLYIHKNCFVSAGRLLPFTQFLNASLPKKNDRAQNIILREHLV